MPRATALSTTAVAWSAGYARNRLPQPIARIETEAPVRPSVRWGSFPATGASAGCAAGRAGMAAAAPTASPLFSRNSLRVTPSFFAMLASFSPRADGSLDQLHTQLAAPPAHHLRVLRARDVGPRDLGVPALLPLEGVEASIASLRQDAHLLLDRDLPDAGEDVAAVLA